MCRLQHSGMPRNFDLCEYNVQYVHKNGGHITDLEEKLHEMTADKPSAVFLQIGGNDFSGKSIPDHTSIPAKLHKLATCIKQTGVQYVIIGKLFYRGKSKYLPNSYQIKTYNDKVTAVNKKLDELATDMKAQNILVWNHKGRVQCAQEMLASDGTHLNERGQKKFWRSIRGALKHCLTIANPGTGSWYCYYCAILIMQQ